MKKTIVFMRKNILEMLRDPIIYIFCLGMPVAMLILFQVINSFTAVAIETFKPSSLIPGIMMFSYTFVMLTMSLIISKDRQTALLKRLYSSPLKPYNYVLGYAIPGFMVGIIQSIICLLTGFIICSIQKVEFIPFSSCLLLIVALVPILIFCVFLGILIGSVLNDKAAPGIVSIFISASGILGGAWMPLDTMGGFEVFCRWLPFYPSVYLGRIITGALFSDGFTPYTFNNTSLIGLITVLIYMVVVVILSFVFFKKQMTSEK